jgi:N-acetylmuramoyl-L-alanine amidase
VQEEVLKGIRTGANPTEVSDRGVKLRADLGVINTAFPSCLVEFLFISNPAEEAMLRQVAWQNTFGWCIAQGVLKWARGR